MKVKVRLADPVARIAREHGANVGTVINAALFKALSEECTMCGRVTLLEEHKHLKVCKTCHQLIHLRPRLFSKTWLAHRKLIKELNACHTT